MQFLQLHKYDTAILRLNTLFEPFDYELCTFLMALSPKQLLLPTGDTRLQDRTVVRRII